VFPEYAGAFAFLLRDWAAGERLGQIGSLVEAAPGWLSEVLTTFLVEQARTGYVPGAGSLAAERIAKALAETGGAWSASILYDAGHQQMSSRFALAARAYFQACVILQEALYAANPDHVEIKVGYAGSLCAVGRFAEAGRLVDAVLALVPEHAYANQLRRYIVQRYIVQQQQSLPPATTQVTPASTAHPGANPAEAARLNM
jgi:hypothetical protein